MHITTQGRVVTCTACDNVQVLTSHVHGFARPVDFDVVLRQRLGDVLCQLPVDLHPSPLAAVPLLDVLRHTQAVHGRVRTGAARVRLLLHVTVPDVTLHRVA